MTTPPKKTYNVAILLFPGADILDFSCPLEIFSCTTYNKRPSPPSFPFNLTLIARTPTIAAGSRGCITVSADTTFDEASKRIDDFEILVVPGGNSPLLLEFAQKGGAEVEFIKAFNALPAREGGDERIILSVCTGAFLVAAAGALKGLRATTHHMALELLKGIDGSIDVGGSVGEKAVGRYVDGGKNCSGTRVVTAGGVTCALDASLYVVELKAGREAAEYQAKWIEHEWKRA